MEAEQAELKAAYASLKDSSIMEHITERAEAGFLSYTQLQPVDMTPKVKRALKILGYKINTNNREGVWVIYVDWDDSRMREYNR